MKKDIDPILNSEFYQYPSCVLQAYGEHFEPELFLQGAKFDSKQILLKGELGLSGEMKAKIPQLEEKLKIFITPFLLIRVSKMKTLSEQIKEATLFLRTYRNDIQKLGHFPQVENVLMQFLVEDKPLFEMESFSREFSELAFSSGIDGLSIGKARSGM